MEEKAEKFKNFLVFLRKILHKKETYGNIFWEYMVGETFNNKYNKS
jgi:hypothetical protein